MSEELEGFEGLNPETVKEVLESEGIATEEQPQEDQPAEESESKSEPEQQPQPVERESQPMQPVQPIQPPKPQPQPSYQITPEVAKTINEATLIGAKQMTGWDDDDIEALDYLEEDDPRRAQWETAKKLAQDRIYKHIERLEDQRRQITDQFINEHKAAVNEFNEYTNRETKDPNFQKVQNYAIGEYYNNQSKSVQMTIARAYDRVLKQTASPQDYYVIKNYYEQAKQSMGNRKTVFPRSSKVTGISGANQSYSEREIERMIDEGNWDEVPEEFINRAMNSSIEVRR